MIVRSNYIVLYRVTDELVEIVNVVHARMQFPRNGDRAIGV